MPSEPNPPRPQEQEAIRTTIVGGRPPGCGKAVGGVPRGIEVLVKKAAVDPEFRSLLLSERGQAARSIGLELSAAESMMLSAVPAAQLRSIIAATTVPQAYMPAFLGKVAAVMLAALGIVQAGCDDNKGQPAGIRPEDQAKDNPAVANRPTAQTPNPPYAVLGARIDMPSGPPATRPPAKPATGPRPSGTEPPAAGTTIDRPETANILGIDPDTPLDALDTPGDAPPIPIAGTWLRTPPARPKMPPPDFTIEPHSATYDIGGMMANKPPTHPAIPREITLEPATGRPRHNISVFGNMGDWTDYSATRDAGVAPAMPADDQPTFIGGIMGDRPMARPAMHLTEPSAPPTIDRPAVKAILNGDADKSQVTAANDQPRNIGGIMADKPPARLATPTDFTFEPAPAQRDQWFGDITINGILADRPTVIKGIRVDRPNTPTTTPTTKPAATPAQPPGREQR